jgi:7-cyano-7-deazaguanine synthase in queuosine biosynthesis
MAKDFAIVLNNGGINSAVATALAAQKFRPIMIYAESGQSSSARQRAAYDQQVTHFKPYREQTVTLPLVAAPNPAQTASADPRAVQPVGPRLIEMLPLISVAVQYANFYQAAAIYLGMRVGPEGDDLAQVTEFFQVWNELVQMPCRLPELELATPLMELEPWQIIDLGYQVAAPFDRTWSCQHEASEPCWSCRGCRAREAAFVQAAKPDPLRAAKRT